MASKQIIETTKEGVFKYKAYLHSETEPAIVKANGDTMWYFMGETHREDGPAIIKNGIQFYCQHGKFHRTDGPAIISKNGDRAWYEDGVLIREEIKR